MRKEIEVPEETIRRLSVYLRILRLLEKRGVAVVSSRRLTRHLMITDGQARRDLAYFGSFGRPGIGYDVQELKTRIEKILGLKQGWQVILVGAGKLGSALLHYPGFRAFGFHVMSAFDNNPRKIGRRIAGILVRDEQTLEAFVRENKIRTAIITVPASAAQKIVDRLSNCGVSAILNFAPCYLTIKKGVHIKNMDMAMELETLAYYLTHASSPKNRAKPGRRQPAGSTTFKTSRPSG